MKTLVKKSVSIIMVIGCLTGSAVFADTNGQEMQEIIEMEVCKAIDVLGGIPEYIQGPDREDLEVMLSNIDECNGAGLFDQANEIWESVYELLALYQEEFGDNTNNEFESKSDEELVQELIQNYEERIMRYENIGDFASAEELRAELEELLKEFYGNNDPHMKNDHEDENFDMGLSAEDVERIIEEREAEIERLEREGNFEEAEALRRELEGFLSEHFGEGHEEVKEGLDNQLSPEDMERIIEETEAEIERLEREGNFEEAEALRRELEGFLSEHFGEGHEEVEEGLDNQLSPEDMERIIEETEAEIENLERVGDFEAAEALRRELEGFLSEHFGEGHEEVEEGLDNQLSPEDMERIIEETEAEIENLERVGDFEAAENLRRELEELIKEHIGEFH